MAACRLFRILISVGLTCVCLVVSFPFFADHHLPSNTAPVNCGGNRTVYTVTAIGHRLCGQDFFYIKKDKLNQFGKDFKDVKYDWPTLCKMDSDNDNRTNGEELGDPECIWNNHYTTEAVSHPGYAEDEVLDDAGNVTYVIKNWEEEEACGNIVKIGCSQYTHGMGITTKQ
ncbi:temptin-like [Saccostrea echinata]|uniref:temptin-like n=1 Tax=Saccostrea echinata TaxID=191078 RepID=UPI002A83A010|nr:temptin-like [Saccostrea echinata]